ncbi:MAG: HD domain-containing protein [Armatimonadota bacterium]
MQLSPRFEEALIYAVQLHAAQFRKGSGIPYISHLLGVAAIVLEHGSTEDEVIAALLHDAVEDQGGLETLAVIRRRFGDVVAEIVLGCTDAHSHPKPPWRQRKEAYIAHLREVSPSVRLVSAADKLHNARCILLDYRTLGETTCCRFAGGKEGVLWYYRALADTFRSFGSTPLVDELDRTVAELEKLAAEGGRE